MSSSCFKRGLAALGAMLAACLIAMQPALLEGQTAPAKYPAYKTQLDQLQAAWKARDFAAAEPIAQAFLASAKQSGDRDAEAEALRMLGAHWQLQGDYAKARQYYEQSLTIRKDLGKDADLLQMNSGLGLTCLTLNDYAAAEKYLAEARRLAQKMGNQAALAQATQLTGIVWEAQGKKKDAAEALQRALAMYKELKNQAGAAAVLLAQGKLALGNGEYGLALRTSFESLQLFRQLKRPADVAKCLDQIGAAFHRLEQPRKALEYYRQALQIQEKVEPPPVIATGYQRIGVELDKLGSRPDAIANFQKALAIWRKGDNPAQTASVLIDLGVTQETSDPAASRENLTAALAICKEGHCGEGDEATALYDLGNVSLREGKLAEALREHQQALQLRRKMKDRLATLRSMNRVSVTLEAQSRWQEAALMHRQAMAEFESIWSKIADPAQAAGFRETAAVLYPHYALTLYKLGQPWQAFRIAERGRGAGLARAAQLNSRQFSDLLSPEDRELWKTLSAREAKARNHLRAVKQAGDEEEASTAEASYLEASREMSQLQDRALADHAELAEGPVLTGATQQQLLRLASQNPETLYLEWVIVDEKQMLLFALSKQRGLQTFRIATQEDKLEKLLSDWYRAIGGIGESRGLKQVAAAPKPLDEKRLAHEMFVAVFGPASGMLEHSDWTRLVGVAYGPLLRIPFPALVNSSGERLIDHLSVSGAVSLTSLVRTADVKAPAPAIYAVGDPLKQGEKRLIAPQNVILEPLQAARVEARSISQLTPGGVAVVGDDAKESRVKREIGRFGVLHFATHGLLDEDTPLRSSLLLATEPEDSDEDGLLEAWEIAGLRLSARLAVLSACETGQGQETLGDGILGLSWAFQAAGCPNVVASLWSVSDSATRTLMLTFYQELKTGKRVDEALRWAMLAVRANQEFESPFFWSAFQAIGPSGKVWEEAPASTNK